MCECSPRNCGISTLCHLMTLPKRRETSLLQRWRSWVGQRRAGHGAEMPQQDDACLLHMQDSAFEQSFSISLWTVVKCIFYFLMRLLNKFPYLANQLNISNYISGIWSIVCFLKCCSWLKKKAYKESKIITAYVSCIKGCIFVVIEVNIFFSKYPC